MISMLCGPWEGVNVYGGADLAVDLICCPSLERSRARTSGISVFAIPYGRVSVLASPSCRDAKRYPCNDPEPYRGSSPILTRFNRSRIIRISML